MHNLKSPITNNMMGGMSYIPPNPIGNIINIGGNGYTGGYYNNTYNGYFNPYMAQRQKEIEEAKRREEIQQQANIWKKLSRNCHKALGNEIENMDEHLKRYDPLPEEENIKEENYFKLVMLSLHGNNHNPRLYANIESNNRMFEKVKEKYPDDMPLTEYLATAGEQYSEAMVWEAKAKEKNVSKLYNSDQYRQLIGLHNNNIGKLSETSIDDMEISLPNHLATEYQRRKQAFLDGILSK